MNYNIDIFNADHNRRVDICITQINSLGEEILLMGADLKESKKLAMFTFDNDFTFSIPEPIARQLFKAIYDKLHNEGYKPENEHKVHGLLEAQTKHLEDMRTILFKNLQIKE
jgi:uncharacterized protein YaaW (UPF0174 family)